MEKYYQWKYLTPSKYHPDHYDPVFASPRLIQPSEMRTCKYDQYTLDPKEIRWKPYKIFRNGDKVYELDAAQRTDPWYLGRAGRVTSSKGFECIGLSPYNKDLVTCALEIAGFYQKERTAEELKIIDDGVQREPLAQMHCASYHKCEIKDLGLLVPSWMPYLGDSPDGEGQIDGQRVSVELKCPVRMYKGLEERLEVIEEGGDVAEDDFTHIKVDHYVQCHFHMFCMNTKYCIYHVCDFNDESPKFFSQIIPFNKEFWAWCLIRIKIFLKYYLQPILRNTRYPVLPY